MTLGKKIVGFAAASSLALGFALTSAPPAEARTKFTSCDQMHRTYPHGISKSSAAANRAYQNGQHKPPVRPTVYADSYKTLDRDKDGTMCEVPR